MARKSILVVDDDKPQRDILSEILTAAGYDVTPAASGEAALKFAKDRSFDLALTDLKMTGMDGIELLQHLLALDSSIIVILLTAHGTIDSAKEALRRGAFDYLQKPFDRDRLLQTIKRALGTLDQIDVEIISASPKMEAVKKMILKVARSNSTVLIRGESGTGKELIARAIHNQSPRSSEMFQAVNCAAINENLLESELFGHEKGSFTGAHAEKKGLFEVADRGTLFLDEIAELDVSMQAKLLRALQERRIRRVGGTYEIPVDVRVVAATNRDLRAMVGDGRFRDDLYYRINVLSIDVPPLRERREDIAPLAEHFLRLHSERYRRDRIRFTPQALEALRQHSWPGNVRELDHVIERAILLSSGETVSAMDLALQTTPSAQLSARLEEMSLEDAERLLITKALARFEGNANRAAEALGLSRSALYRRMQKYRLS